MATQVKHRRGTDAEIMAGTPAIGELWFNTTDNSIHMGDGVTQGGVKHLNADLTNYTFKASQSQSAVANMVDGIPSSPRVGDICSTGYTLWLRISNTNGDITDFEPITPFVSANDYGADSSGATPSDVAISAAKSTGYKVLLSEGNYEVDQRHGGLYSYGAVSTSGIGVIDLKRMDFETRNSQQVVQFVNKRQPFNNKLIQELTTDTDKVNDSVSGEDIFYQGPATLVLPTGRIVTAYTVKHGENVDPGQSVSTWMSINVKLSDDNGRNSITKTAISKGRPWNLSVGTIFLNPKDGKIYLFYSSTNGQLGWGFSQQGWDESNTAQTKYITSDDGGETWSGEFNITQDVKPFEKYFYFPTPTRAVVDADGRMMVPVAWTNTINSQVETSYIYSRDGLQWFPGEVLTTEQSPPTGATGATGGEMGFGLNQDGSVYLVDRAFYDDPVLGYRVAWHHIYEYELGKVTFIGQVRTSDCKASWFSLGPQQGCNKEIRLLIGPIGNTGLFDGRKNLRAFDITDPSSPVDLGLMLDAVDRVGGYSQTEFLPSGALYSCYDGQQVKIHETIWTPNRLSNSYGIIDISSRGLRILPDLSVGSLRDIVPGEEFELDNGEKYISTGFGSAENVITERELVITSVVSTLDLTGIDTVYFQSGANESVIQSITGSEKGKYVVFYVESGSIEIEFERNAAGAGANRINFDDYIKYDGSANVTYNKLKLGNTAVEEKTSVTMYRNKFEWRPLRGGNAI